MSDIVYRELAQAVVNMNASEVRRLAHFVLENGIPPDEAIEKGLAVGMNEVGRLFAAKEYFVPEVLVCAEAMYIGFNLLKDKVAGNALSSKGMVVIGVVEGDYHDIGKNIVKLILQSSGFSIIDLGKNVRVETFIETLEEHKSADIVALSTLMSTTMENMEAIKKAISYRFPGVKIMVGGAPVNKDFADAIGAHFYGKDARQALEGAHKLMSLKIED